MNKQADASLDVMRAVAVTTLVFAFWPELSCAMWKAHFHSTKFI
jgi:hypothetical protein